MYDPSWTIWHGWKEIIKHWRLLYKISKANHAKGIPYLDMKESRQMFSDSKKIDLLMNGFQFAASKNVMAAQILHEPVL